ncbi:MAG: rod shape-determining protein [Bacteroidota bacterium]|nr:rod shape-determining protein [Candidatus Kapabacteria bacterium]MCS7302615.1 rod shape-determining protein [Candidatus Kapabacteria bacterium]MCX7936451.1 rod shape-determining protein [Chlorobiota bacterium]MDW8074269.1 rod shape-determining protein [Bacteroidota bacterium]MDW8271255.1 rod shape-determining protein [Bacteroidota bacterium]
MRFSFFSNDLAIDLGTANTLVWMKGRGIVLNEPSIVAFDRTTKNIIAVGHEANAMVGKTHKDIRTIRPLKDGVIADFEIAEGMLRAFIRKVSQSWQPIRRVVIGVPSGITEVEKRAVRDSAEHAGAKEVYLIAEPMAAAIGIGLEVHQSVGNMIVDIGGGTTEIAVIALSGIVSDESIRVAGDEMTDAIVQYFKRKHNMLIGERTAEMIKHEVGSAYPIEEDVIIEVKGRDLLEGIPRMIEVSSADIREALEDSVRLIIEAIMNLLERTPPELAADIFDRGIILAGGGALLKGLDERISRETRLPVHVADDPLTAVVRGAGKVLENLPEYASVLLKSKRY